MNSSQRTVFGRVASLAAGVLLCGALLSHGVTEEVPLGGVDGVVTMPNGAPLPNAMVTLRPLEHSAGDQIRARHIETDENGRFLMRNVLAGRYALEVSGRAHNIQRYAMRVEEGRPAQLELEAVAVPPYLELYASQRVFTPEESAGFQLKGFSESKAVKVSAYKLDFEKVIKEGSLYSALAPLSFSSYRGQAKNPTTMGRQVQQFDHTVENRDVEGVFVDNIRLPELEEGIYWVEAHGDKVQQGTWFSVSRIAVISKNDGRTTTCYVTDLKTGKPVAGASVGYPINGSYREAARTGERGTAAFAQAPGDNTAVVAIHGDSRAFVSLYQDDASDPQTRIVAYTDRPVYRPGDEVMFKGIVRRLSGSDYRLPEGGQVSIEIRDADDTLIQRSSPMLTELGTFDGRFQLNREAAPGWYSIVMRHGSAEEYHSFTVAAYRKPHYSIRVSPERPSYIRGDRVRMFVDAEYYFGGPVVGAEVEAYIYRDIYWDPGHYGEDYAEFFADEEEWYGHGGEFVERVTVRTDSNGRAVIDFGTRMDEGAASEFDYRYNVQASVVDESGKYFDGQGSVRVLRGEMSVRVETEQFIVGEGQPVQATIYTRAQDGTPLPNTRLTVTSGIDQWDGHQSVITTPKIETLVTGADGTARYSVTPSRAGSFRVRASAPDQRGNLVAASESVWVSGRDAAFAGPAPKLEVKLDRRQYEVGQQATAMIQTDRPGGSALVTVEGDRLYSAQVVPLNDNLTTVQLPVLEEYAPNAYVAVAYIRDKRFSESSKRLNIDISSRELNIQITPDRSRLQPGETVTYRIQAAHENGSPAVAEVSVGVVDEAIYAIAEDRTNLLSSFYPRRYNRVQTQYSFPELYLDGGDKAPTSLQVRREFKDTAYWAPRVLTDSLGRAEVQVKLPDNLTTWRATAIGVTGDTAVGKGTCRVQAAKDLMVRLEAPSFIVSGDRQTLRAIVTNATANTQTVRVQLEPTGVRLENNRVHTVTVQANSSQVVEHAMEVVNTGTAKIVAKAWTEGGLSDGVELTIPALAHGRLLVERTGGEIRGQQTASVTLQQGADLSTGRLQVSVSPFIGSALVQSLDDLIDFPYGCVEQTMSRFMPAVVVQSVVAELQLPTPARAAEIPQIAAESYTRLGKMLGYRGGWGWWEHDEPNPYMTAYVLEGMHFAHRAGYPPPNPFHIEQAVNWAREYLAGRAKQATTYLTDQQQVNDRAYLAYAVALHSPRDAAAQAVFDGLDVAKAPTASLAYAVQGYQALGLGGSPRQRQAIEAIAQRADRTPAGTYWTENYYGFETTARVLLALVTAQPDHPMIEEAVRYLLVNRQGRSWHSTRDTAVALLGISAYLRNAGGVAASDVHVSLNGREIGVVSASEPGRLFDIALTDLRPGQNELRFESSAGSVAYYGAEIRQVVAQNQVAAAPGQGLRIERNYYRLEPRRLEDGTMRLLPSRSPVNRAAPGDLLRVVLRVTNDRDREYMLIEDPIPSGCRITERDELMEGESWPFWWSRTVVLDDKASFFARYMRMGVGEFTYTIRVENPGRFSALPTEIYNMYEPQDRASAGSHTLEVR